MRNFLSIIAWLYISSLCNAAERPNILWITAEDMSPTLGCYGDEYASTPHIDHLAKESVRYTHAFATAPVCSPSRSCLITGCYATSLGTHQMRSGFPIPDFIKGFPSYLREQGYYTTNNVKTDYNTANEPQIVKASWDESSAEAHWRDRPKKSQPFFSVFNLMTSHQSRTMVWPYERFQKEVQSRLSTEQIHDPDKAPLPPYYPDTPVIRKTVARFYDCVTAMDQEVGTILKQLAEDGLAANTIVFFYSDHGSGMPRHKRCLYDSGMHVPLLVRFPEKWKHLAPKQDDRPLAAGDTTDRLVSFVDFGPTVLSLTDIDIPDYMQGEPFLGKAETKPREYVFGHRDRVDEVIDMSRSVRTKRYLYIRNYMPHLGWNQPTAWPDQGEIRHEFYRLTDREKMTDAQWQFAGPTRPVIEIYDCEKDSNNLQNLAESSDHKAIAAELAAAAAEHQLDEYDWGWVPEQQAQLIARERNLWTMARVAPADRYHPTTSAYVAGAIAGLGSDDLALRQFDSNFAATRYWAAVGFAHRDTLTNSSRRKLQAALTHDSSAVRIAAADTLARHGEVEQAVPILVDELEAEDLTTALYAARAIELLGDDAKAAIPAMEKALARAEKIRPPDTPATVVTSGDQDLAMFISFSTRAFLKKVKGNDQQEGAKGTAGDRGPQGQPAAHRHDETTQRSELDAMARLSSEPAPDGATDSSGVNGRNNSPAERTAHHQIGRSPRPHQSADSQTKAWIDSASTKARLNGNSRPQPFDVANLLPSAEAGGYYLSTLPGLIRRDVEDLYNCAAEADDAVDTTKAGPDESAWINLFDGKSLNGWSARAKGDVQAKDGEIQILSKGANLWLVHEGEFADFELIVEAKMPDDAYNSGIGFRCTGEGKPKGYQCEVDRAKSGMIYAIGSGWVWPKGAEETKRFNEMSKDAFDNAKWNTFRIRCAGDHIQIWVNDKQTADVHDGRFAKGSIALQHHGKGGLHSFRNIKLRKLP